MAYLPWLVVFLVTLLFVDWLVRERGWNRHRWAVAAITVGPLAIPLVIWCRRPVPSGR
jgi:hypothetical protein